MEAARSSRAAASKLIARLLGVRAQRVHRNPQELVLGPGAEARLVRVLPHQGGEAPPEAARLSALHRHGRGAARPIRAISSSASGGVGGGESRSRGR